MKKGILKNEKGVSLVLLALSIVVLFGFAALAIDVGHLYAVKNELQVAADAAALAGVKLLTGDDTLQKVARAEAMKIAGRNVADIAGSVVPAYHAAGYNDTFAGGANPGQPIPIALEPNNNNDDPNGDIVVGWWNGTTFIPAPSSGFTNTSSVINAIRVVARRTDGTGNKPYQPQVNNWFAKVFALLPGSPDFSIANVSATAIAAKTKLSILPIAVNEYWDEAPAKDGAYPPGAPYGQYYPQSFMRSINVDGSAGLAGTSNNIFAIIGAAANKNNVANTMTGYMDIFDRNAYHNRRDTDWHEFNADSADGACESDCSTDEFPVLPGGLKTGGVSNKKYNEIFSFLFNGIPDNIIPPNAVREAYRNPDAYADDNYCDCLGGCTCPSFGANDPSECPYATVAYFTSTGNIPGLPQGPDKQRFIQRWGKGDQFMVMVYDGTANKGDYPDQAGAVTVVGYGIIELDGYLTTAYNGDPTTLYPGGSAWTGQPVITAFGHAIPHKLAGEEDPYIIQPSVGDPTPECSFTTKLETVRNNFGEARLVDPSLHYGVH